MGRGEGKGAEKKISGDRGTKYNPKYWYIDGVAYDLTPFVKEHPGGEYALFLGQGRECTPMIYSYHMDVEKVRKFAQPYKCPDDQQLDDLVVDKFEPFKKFTYNENDFYCTLRREVVAWFKKEGKSMKGGTWDVFTFIMMVSAMLGCMVFICMDDGWKALAAAFVHGIVRALMVVQHTHGASHFALSQSASVNRWVYRFGTIFIGLWNPPVWDLQHVVAHHIYTNEWPYDTDSAFPLKSIAYNQKRYWYHKFQHIYMWAVYVFTIPLVCLNSVKDTIIQRQVLYKMRLQASSAHVEAWTCSILALTYLSLPFVFGEHGFLRALALAVFSNAVSSVTFSFQFVVNHEVDKPGVMDGPPPSVIDWGAYQCKSSNTFSGESRLSTWFAGGLNTQIEHHLFPSVWHAHYVDVARITKKVCKDFNIHYNDSPNLLDALQCHYRLLKNPPKSIRDEEDRAKKATKKSKKVE